LWSGLDEETQKLAARSLYHATGVAGSGRAEADEAIAAAIRFRVSAVRRLPVDRRVGYLIKAVRPDDSLACTLLLALHLEQRVRMLEAFLVRLGIPQQRGLIDESHELQPPDPEALAAAVDELSSGFPRDEVELYLTSLIAFDRDTWGGLARLLKRQPAG
jgi:hypothetical protein